MDISTAPLPTTSSNLTSFVGYWVSCCIYIEFLFWTIGNKWLSNDTDSKAMNQWFAGKSWTTSSQKNKEIWFIVFPSCLVSILHCSLFQVTKRDVTECGVGKADVHHFWEPVWAGSRSKLPEILKDREAWHAAVPEVAKSQTWLDDWTTIIK